MNDDEQIILRKQLFALLGQLADLSRETRGYSREYARGKAHGLVCGYFRVTSINSLDSSNLRDAIAYVDGAIDGILNTRIGLSNETTKE